MKNMLYAVVHSHIFLFAYFTRSLFLANDAKFASKWQAEGGKAIRIVMLTWVVLLAYDQISYFLFKLI